MIDRRNIFIEDLANSVQKNQLSHYESYMYYQNIEICLWQPLYIRELGPQEFVSRCSLYRDRLIYASAPTTFRVEIDVSYSIYSLHGYISHLFLSLEFGKLSWRTITQWIQSEHDCF